MNAGSHAVVWPAPTRSEHRPARCPAAARTADVVAGRQATTEPVALAAASFVLAFGLMADVEFFIGPFSFQKLLSIAVLPICIISLRRRAAAQDVLRLSCPALILLAGSFLSVGFAQTFDFAMVILAGLVGAVTLAMVSRAPGGLRIFTRTIIVLGCLSAAAGLAQRTPLAPSFLSQSTTVGSGVFAEEVRLSGLRNDPNFEALSLVLALSLTGLARLPVRARWTVELLLLAGIFATLSRMGFVLVGVLFLRHLLGRSPEEPSRVLKVIKGVTVLVLVVTALSAVSPTMVKTAASRFSELSTFLDSARCRHSNCASNGFGGTTSEGERGALLAGAVAIAADEFPYGVGPDTRSALYARTGVPNFAHNTFLEVILVGGLVGLAALIVYFYVWIRQFRSCRWRELRTASVVVLAAWPFLSFLMAQEFLLANALLMTKAPPGEVDGR